MQTRYIHKLTILAVILALFLVACASEEPETAEPTNVVVVVATQANAESAEATDEATEEADMEITEEATEEADTELTEEATKEADTELTEEATEEADTEMTEEATDEADMEMTEEATEEVDEEATEEATEEVDEVDEEASTIMFLTLEVENLETFSVALVQGDFLTTLNDEGPYTIFAPTDDAFAEALDSLDLSAGEFFTNEDLLNSVLSYHIIEGEFLSEDFEDGEEIETLNGTSLTISVSDEGVTVSDESGNTYEVIAEDTMASNGVVHVIDGVLMPEDE